MEIYKYLEIFCQRNLLRKTFFIQQIFTKKRQDQMALPFKNILLFTYAHSIDLVFRFPNWCVDIKSFNSSCVTSVVLVRV